MNITGIENYLNEYIKQDNPQYAVMLKGKWGCGKTFFIKQRQEILIQRVVSMVSGKVAF